MVAGSIWLLPPFRRAGRGVDAPFAAMSTETWILVLAVVFLAATVAIVPLLVRSRIRQGAGAVSHELDARPSDLPASGDPVVLVPLPTRRGEALVLGSERSLEAFDRSGLTRRSPASARGPLPQVVRQVMAHGCWNANRNAQTGIDSGRIVALSEETMKQLKTGRPVYDKSGNVLALVRGEKGRLQHVMRLDRAGAQDVVASNVATLAVTAALSQQLEHIEQQLTQIRATLDGLVADIDRGRL